MYQKLKILYLHHFKLVFVLNFAVSLFFLNLFFEKGFDKITLYNLAIFFKLFAYAIALGAEKLLFSRRSFHYQNLALSYRRIFSTFYIFDFSFFVFLLTLTWLWKNFI